MTKGTVRKLVTAYMMLFLAGTVWPGVTLFNQAEPLILGLPFNLFVLAVLISLALVMLAALYISETRSGD